LRDVDADDPDYLSPNKRFKNTTSHPGIDSYSFAEEPFGLVRFWHEGPTAFTEYTVLGASERQVLIRCCPSENRLPFPSCQGKIYVTEERLGFYIQFPRERLPQWREIQLAIRELVQSWRMDQ